MKKPIDERLAEGLDCVSLHISDQWQNDIVTEVRDLRLSFQRLHRRCQRAEAAAAGKLRHAEPKTFGRGLMAWAYAEEKKRNEELEAKLRGLDEIANTQQS